MSWNTSWEGTSLRTPELLTALTDLCLLAWQYHIFQGKGLLANSLCPQVPIFLCISSQCIWLRGFSVMETEMNRQRKRGQWHLGASTAREIPVAARMPVRMPAEERACLLCLNVCFSKTHILSEMWRAEIETRPHMKLSRVPGSSSPALPPPLTYRAWWDWQVALIRQ